MPEQVRIAGPIRHERPRPGEIARTEDCGHSFAKCRCEDRRTVRNDELINCYIKCIRPGLQALEGRTDILGSTDCEWGDFEAEPAGFSLSLTHLQHRLRIVSIKHDGQTAKLGHDLAQKFKSLASKLVGLNRQPGHVPAGFRETGDQAAPNGVYSDRKDNRNSRCRLLHNRNGTSDRDNHVDIESDKLRGNFSVALWPTFRPTIFDRDGPPIDPAKFAHARHKSGYPGSKTRRICAQKPDGWELARLLRARRKRPYRRHAAKQRNEVAPSHRRPQN